MEGLQLCVHFEMAVVICGHRLAVDGTPPPCPKYTTAECHRPCGLAWQLPACFCISLPTHPCRKAGFNWVFDPNAQNCSVRSLLPWTTWVARSIIVCRWISLLWHPPSRWPPASPSSTQQGAETSVYLMNGIHHAIQGTPPMPHWHQQESIWTLVAFVSLFAELGCVESVSLSFANVQLSFLFLTLPRTLLRQFLTQRWWDLCWSCQWSPFWAESNRCAKRKEETEQHCLRECKE